MCVDARPDWRESAPMALSTSGWRAALVLVAAGAGAAVASVVLVGRDVAFARAEAESEVVALAEAGALALPFAPPAGIQQYLEGLVRHPAIAGATLFSPRLRLTAGGRSASVEAQFIERLVPSLREPVIACRAFEAGTLCLEGDAAYFRNRAAALLVPHLILLGASLVLLAAAIVIARGSSRGPIAELARIVDGAATSNDYSLRAHEGKGAMGALSRAVNKLLEQMQQRDVMLRRRTTELETSKREAEAFSYSVSHDLRSPLASIEGFSTALQDFYGDRLDDDGKEYLRWIRESADQMKNLIAGMLQMSRISRSEVERARVDLSAVAESIIATLRQKDAARTVDFRVEEGMIVNGDERLLHAVLENLLSNAYKFTSKRERAQIEVGSTSEGGRRAYFVRDNGAGFDSTQAAKMFTAFQRLHSASEFEGTGIGLATVKRIIEKHGGSIWADGKVGEGATFFFTLADGPLAGERAEVAELTRA
jgi:signal transduction histidine kinase